MSATDEIETSVAPSAIERALAVFEKFKEQNHAELVQARKALTDHIFGQVAAGQTDEQRLVVAGLAHLKSIERMTAAAMKTISHSGRRRGEPEDGAPATTRS